MEKEKYVGARFFENSACCGEIDVGIREKRGGETTKESAVVRGVVIECTDEEVCDELGRGPDRISVMYRAKVLVK